MCGGYDIAEAICRCQAFAAAGADVVYVPAPSSMADLARICAEVKAPVNALIAGQFTGKTMADFADIGVARLSLGSSLARVTHRAIHDAACEMFQKGGFSLLGNGINSDIVDALLRKE